MKRTACWSCDGVGCARCPRHPDGNVVPEEERGTERAKWYFGKGPTCCDCGVSLMSQFPRCSSCAVAKEELEKVASTLAGQPLEIVARVSIPVETHDMLAARLFAEGRISEACSHTPCHSCTVASCECPDHARGNHE